MRLINLIKSAHSSKLLTHKTDKRILFSQFIKKLQIISIITGSHTIKLFKKFVKIRAIFNTY